MPSPATLLIHGDDSLRPEHSQNVASELNVSATFRYAAPSDPLHVQRQPPVFDPLGQSYIYSRITNPSMGKTEKLIGELCGGHALTVTAGLSAAFLALIHYNPPAIAIRDGYHGCHKTIGVFQRIRPDMVSTTPVDSSSHFNIADSTPAFDRSGR